MPLARIPTLPLRPWRALGIAFVLALVACSPGQRPEAGWPEGALLVARRDAVADVLARLDSLTGTPLGREARRIAGALPACDLVEAAAPSPADWRSALACGASDGPLAALHAALGESDLLFALPAAGDAPRLVGRARVRDGDVTLEIEWPDAASDGPLALLLPGGNPTGPDVLAAEGRLVHARIRPAGGVDLAALVPEGSQGDRLFRLRGDLFSAAVLDGTWEGALYLPEAATGTPQVALALGFRVRRAAIAAADRFVSELETTWPVHRVPFATQGATGVCLPDLNVLPGFAPCYVAGKDALVVGWDASSVERALAGTRAVSERTAAQLEVDLSGLAEADTLLAARLAADDVAPPLHWPWRRLRAEGRRQGSALHLRVALEGATP